MRESKKSILSFMKGQRAVDLVMKHAEVNGLEIVDVFKEIASTEIWLKAHDMNTTACYYITDTHTVETLYEGV